MGDKHYSKTHAAVKRLNVQDKIVANQSTKQDNVRAECNKTFG